MATSTAPGDDHSPADGPDPAPTPIEASDPAPVPSPSTSDPDADLDPDDVASAIPAAEVLSPIPGRALDEPPRPAPRLVERLEARTAWAGVTWLAYQRFRAARGPVLAGGTAYYAFLAMFSLLALGYGVAALVSADQLSHWLTEALEEALPGLVGEEGIDPATLQEVGRTASIAGLVVLAYSGSAVMVATSDSLHALFGAPPDGRGILVRRVHLLGWLALLGPLVVVSYAASGAIGPLASEALDAIGLESTATRALVTSLAVATTVAIDIGITALLLTRLGGIRPHHRARRIGAVVGGLTATALKAVMAAVVAWALRKPQYGSLAVPIAALVVLWFQAVGLYAAAALTAAIAAHPPPRRTSRHG